MTSGAGSSKNVKSTALAEDAAEPHPGPAPEVASIQEKLMVDFHDQARRESGEAILHGSSTEKPSGLVFVACPECGALPNERHEDDCTAAEPCV